MFDAWDLSKVKFLSNFCRAIISFNSALASVLQRDVIYKGWGMSGLESNNDNFDFQNENQAHFLRLLAKASSAYEKNELNEAKALGLRALSIPHECGEPLFELYKTLGNIDMRLGDFSSAEEFYNKAYTINPNSAQLLVNYGALAIMNHDLNKAVDSFRAAVKNDALNVKAWTGLATVHRDFGDHELAWANIERALDIEPTFETAILLVVDWSMKDNELERSVKLIERFIKYVPGHIEVRKSLAQLKYLSGQLDGALEHVQFLLRKMSDDTALQGMYLAIQAERAARTKRFV
jgi:tetratricopeptide (TPR) repeat protein